MQYTPAAFIRQLSKANVAIFVAVETMFSSIFRQIFSILSLEHENSKAFLQNTCLKAFFCEVLAFFHDINKMIFNKERNRLAFLPYFL
ncbi:hypothetical protein Sez_0634 [Streptococcus equi subsp. zooepidemicus MGCS10565]|uniref:Uncharacterized protein n=1 Tax=Streptococcus equi subsp. zooepidemicus (strain MGCS10565) TaxID=552526 RepID=B4U1Y4_STREM|nr:hypothetical protein Sez_0634 [Streptococcus equi subsp. zooepidemicus MGCS10565]